MSLTNARLLKHDLHFHGYNIQCKEHTDNYRHLCYKFHIASLSVEIRGLCFFPYVCKDSVVRLREFLVAVCGVFLAVCHKAWKRRNGSSCTESLRAKGTPSSEPRDSDPWDMRFFTRSTRNMVVL